MKGAFLMHNYSILNELNIDPNNVKSVEELMQDNEHLVFITLKANQTRCPYCGNKAVLKEYKEETIRTKIRNKSITNVFIRKPRYVCKTCHKTYTQNISDIAINSLSNKTISDIKEMFRQKISFTDIAKIYCLPKTQIIRIFDSMKIENNVVISEAICIDEFKNCKNALGKYACIIVNFDNHEIVDILEDRTLPYLRQYFSRIPLGVREFVKYIVADMYDGYLTIAREYFPNAVVAIDPFHYMRYLTDAVQRIRKDLLNNRDLDLPDRTWIGNHWQLVTADRKTIENLYSTLSNGTKISYNDRIERFVRQNDKLNYSYLLLQDVFYDLKHEKESTAYDTIQFYIDKMKNSGYEELISVGKTWENYHKEISNSFIIFKGKRLSNGPVEGINNTEKTVIKFSYGFKDYKRLRKRVLLIANKDKVKG